MADISIKGHSPILRQGYKKGGSVYHTTKEGKKARKGLWYNIHQKRKRGGKPRKPGSKGAPTAEAIKRSQLKEGGSAAWTRKEGK